MLHIRKRFSSKFLRHGIVFLLLCGLFLMFLLQFVNDAFFDTDEGDIYANGCAIASGYHLYSEVYSQHMPFTYYFSALFWELGAQSIISQRIAFYCFFVLSWTILYFRYQSDIGKTVLILYPILLCFAVCTYDMGTTVLSEHLAGLGFVILVLEYIRFCKRRNLSVSSCIFISYAIILTFGTIFIAAYGVAVVALFVVVKEIQWLIEDQTPFSIWIRNCLKLFLKLAFWCLLPWGILMVYYSIIGCLKDAIYYAYTFNREVYSIYTGGYGSSALEGALSGLKNLFEMITSYFNSPLSLASSAQIAICFLSVIGIIYQFAEKRFVEGCAMVVLIIALATRGIWNFHGTQCVSLFCLLAAIASKHIFSNIIHKGTCVKEGVFIALCYLIIASIYFTNLSNPFSASDTHTMMSRVLDVITDEGEPVWSTALGQNTTYIQSKTTPYKAITTPWFSEAAAQNIMEEYPQGPTRIIIHNTSNSVWGVDIQDYAPELCEYIDANYSHLFSLLYVRNDVYDEVLRMISEDEFMQSFFNSRPKYIENVERKTVTITIENPTYEGNNIYFAVWSADDGQDDLFWYAAEPMGDGSIGCTVDLQAHLGNLNQGQMIIHIYMEKDGEMLLLSEDTFMVDLPRYTHE